MTVEHVPRDVPPGEGPPAGRAEDVPGPVLRRPREGRVVLGVAAGLARYVGVDPVLVRIGFVLLTVFGGSGLVLYAIGALVVPVEGPADHVGRATAVSGHDAGIAVGAVLVVAGTLALVDQVLPQAPSLLGPVLLVAAGVAVMLATRRS